MMSVIKTMFRDSLIGCRLSTSSYQACPATSTLDVLFDQEGFDTANMHSLSTNTERIYARISGYYFFSVNGYFLEGASGTYTFEIIVNSVTIASSLHDHVNTEQKMLHLSCIAYLNVGEYAYFKISNSGSASMSVRAGLLFNCFKIG